MPDGLTRAQRRTITAVMRLVEGHGFVIAGGVALIESGVSGRPTEDLDAFSSTCRDVGFVTDGLVDALRTEGFIVDVHRVDVSFAQMTVSSGRHRRVALRVELGRDTQLFEAVTSPLGPILSVRELAANKALAAFGRHEPRDLVDLAALVGTVPFRQALIDARRKDPGFSREVFVDMVTRTSAIRDVDWPPTADVGAVRSFVNTVLLDPDALAVLNQPT